MRILECDVLFTNTSTFIVKIFIVFFFVPILINSCASSQKQLDCENFRIGRYTLHSEFDNSVSLIERNDSIQTETNNHSGNILKAKIKWTGKCEYELTYLEETTISTDTIVPFIKSRPLKVIILKTTTEYYIFKATMRDTDKSLVDTLHLLK